jgi:hypothetical protein
MLKARRNASKSGWDRRRLRRRQSRFRAPGGRELRQDPDALLNAERLRVKILRIRPRYSARSAIMGSVRVARRAGT